MADLGALLKQEIARLSRREIRSQIQATKKASAQHRRTIASLKRQIATMERQIAVIQRRVPANAITASASTGDQKLRFVAKGLKSHRARLGLSAAEVGKLVGVSAQSVYNWEQGQASPRAEQVKMIAKLRALGKREATRLLEELDAKK